MKHNIYLKQEHDTLIEYVSLMNQTNIRLFELSSCVNNPWKIVIDVYKMDTTYINQCKVIKFVGY